MKNINLILLTIISLVLLVGVNAASVSHSASEITEGTFGSGDYTFPNNLVVGSNIILGGVSRSGWPSSGVTSISAGSGLSGGGSSSSVTLSVDTGTIQKRVSTPCPSGQAITSIDVNGVPNCETIPEPVPLDKQLQSGDIGAVGVAAYGAMNPICSSPPRDNLCGCQGRRGGAGCNWWVGTTQGQAGSWGEEDPRGILKIVNTAHLCYTGWGTYPNCKTAARWYTAHYTCDSGWSVAGSGFTSRIANMCTGINRRGCIAALCRRP